VVGGLTYILSNPEMALRNLSWMSQTLGRDERLDYMGLQARY